MADLFTRFAKWYDEQSVQLKERVLKYVYEHRPRPHLNIAELMGFENRGQKFDLNLAQGQIAEKELEGILAGKIEVKCDARVSQTGNLAVEYCCSDMPSGISTSQSPWWAFILDGARYQKEVVILIKKERLVGLLDGARSVSGGDGNRARMYLLRKEKLLQ
jgi:hypothetical protein